MFLFSDSVLIMDSSAPTFVCVNDYKKEANKILPRMASDFYSRGAMSEETLHENEESIKRWQIRPRILVDVSECDTLTSVLGHEVRVPFGVAPVGIQKMAHSEGERASARATAQMGTIFTLSTAATTSIEEISVEGGIKFFQLYVLKDKEKTKEVIKRVEKAGFAALVITLDAPVLGNRYYDRRNKFSVPSHLRMPNYGKTYMETLTESKRAELFVDIADLHEQKLTWEDMAWLNSCTDLPIVLKGIMTSEDALKGIEMGAAAIWVSNHGGRQLDGAASTIDALDEVLAAVGDKCEVYVDGGFRTGSDIFKALAIGARMVFLGRPIIWGLACGGESGVRSVLNLLKDELETTMKLSGYPSLQKISIKAIMRRASRL